jgi:hypothetical protein
MPAWLPSIVVRRFLPIFLLSSALTTPARAGTVDSAAAQALFERGRELMLEQRFQEACEKFAESQALEPEVGTLMNLALCHEQLGQLATAYLEYNDALASSLRASDTARVDLSRQRLAEIEPRLARVTIAVEEPKTSPGFWVKLDGISLGASALDTPIPVDLGRHEVEAGANGKSAVHVEVRIDRAGTTFPITIPRLVEEPREPSELANSRALIRAVPDLGNEREPQHVAAPVADDDSARARTSMIAGVSIGVAAVATLVGTYFGIDAFNEWDERNRHCTSKGCDDEAVRAKSRAERSARMANLSFATAVLAGGVGLYVVVTANTKAGGVNGTSSAEASPTSTMLYATGSF